MAAPGAATGATVSTATAVDHRTRFDHEIVAGLAEIPPDWEIGGRWLRRSGGAESTFASGDGVQHTVRAVERRLAAPPGSRDAVKLDSQIWYERPGAAPEPAAHGPAFSPHAAALPGGAVLVVFRLGGWRPSPAPPAGRSWTAADGYPRQREGGGASVGYAYRDGGGHWQRGWVAQAEEILVRDRMEQDPLAGRLYPAFETLGAPALGLDRHGVPWCLWANPVRRHTYFARWLGPRHGFSAPLEARGALYALGDRVALEAQAPPDASDLLCAAGAGGRVFLSRLPVPFIDARDRRHVLFLDLLEVGELAGAVQRLGRAEKRPENPIVTPEAVAAARDTPVRPLGAPRVWRHDGRDGCDGGLRMELGARGPMGGGAKGVLASADGLSWRLIPAAAQTVDGAPAEDCVVTWFQDLDEPDPAQRYKGVLIRGNWIQNRGRWLVVSADAQHWRTAGEMAGIHQLGEHGGPNYRDPASGEYVAVGRTWSSAHRALGMLRSHDLVHWYGDEALLDVDDPYGAPAQLRRGHYVAERILDPSGERGADQIYWGVAWPEHGLTLCLYGRYRWDARYDAALAVSRDGRNFMRVANGESLLTCGAPGEWDSGIVFMDYGVAAPVRFPKQGVIRLYYAGSTWRHGADPYRVPSAVGAADLPEDGWAYLQPAPDTPLPAMVTTIPIDAAPGAALHVAASGDVVWSAVAADTATPLPGLPATGRFRLRFTLRSHESKLYSFRFEPSPPG
jgi:hypothetical protein